jgi:hypothetical protein
MSTITCPFPSNINPLSPNGFQLSITKLPELSYFCQQAEIPSISLPAPIQATPLSNNIMAGDILEYTDFNVQFLIDENMANYKAIFNWMIGLGFPENHEQYDNFRNQSAFADLSDVKKNFSDGFLQILGNNNQVVQTVQFFDMYPTNLQSLTFQSTNQDVNYLIGNVTFRYDIYKFV